MNLFASANDLRIIPRDYQDADVAESFRQWQAGTVGTLTRAFTGGGKTLMACLKAARWLDQGPEYRFMVVSYEQQLVWQFAQEIEDYLGLTPAIEMDTQVAAPDARVVVVSRQSVVLHKQPDPEQVADLRAYGVHDLGACTRKQCESFLKYLRGGGDPAIVVTEIERRNEQPEAVNGRWSRLHKFDWRYHWLVCFDEAHRHAHHLISVGHIADWFGQNPAHRRFGLTATPKRGDQKSIGHKMFPGVTLDMPLYHVTKPCAVREGWAVPYVQKYIAVEGVDFKNIKRIAGDFDEAALEEALTREGGLAKLVEPLLDLAGDRRTLIFSPTVQMAKDVAAYINARSLAACPVCSKRKWHPTLLIGDGAMCDCRPGGQMISSEHVIRTQQARQLDGSSPAHERKQTYRGHQEGEFQFLSVCGLCREGYNDPDISCVAVFRPVSKKASSLAEQMKGRSCRPCRAIARRLSDCPDAEARLRMIAESSKPDSLIVDLVGITGLADCASTLEIYAEGLPDEIVKRAQEIVETQQDITVDGAIEQAQREEEETKERIRVEREARERQAREEAERRARADPSVQYTAHGVGYGGGPDTASDAQLRLIRWRGMELVRVELSRKKAGRMIRFLKQRRPFAEIARLCGLLDTQWRVNPPSTAQLNLLRGRGYDTGKLASAFDAHLVIEAIKEPEKCESMLMQGIEQARDHDDLDGSRKDLELVWSRLTLDARERLGQAGAGKRRMFGERGEA